MFEQQNQAYFARREAEERAAAQAATAKEARAIHLQMAYCYAALRQQAASDVLDRVPPSTTGHA
jgi:hypothetical protein